MIQPACAFLLCLYLFPGTGHSARWANTTSSPDELFSHELSTPNSSTGLRNGSASNPQQTSKPFASIYNFGNISPEASSCEDNWASYSSLSHSFLVLSSYTTTVLYNITKTIPISPAPRRTTLCDGHARLIEGQNYRVTTVLGPVRVTNTLTISSYTGVLPLCSIDAKDCSLLTKSFLSAWTASYLYSKYGGHDKNEDNFWEVWQTQSWKFSLAPGCTTGPNNDCGKTCKVGADRVRLFYFPVSVAGDLCNRSTIEQTPTIKGLPNTAVYDGTTFTSGSVYLSFDRVWAQKNTEGSVLTPCGTAHRDVIVSMRSDELSSIGGLAFASTYSFNYADLIPPFQPWSVFEHRVVDACNANIRCSHLSSVGTSALSYCSSYRSSLCNSYPVPYDPNGFEPDIDVPTHLLKVDPLWSTCQPVWYGVIDPPVALAGVSEIIQTADGYPQITGTPASPGSAPVPPLPQATRHTALPDQQGPSSGGGSPGGSSSSSGNIPDTKGRGGANNNAPLFSPMPGQQFQSTGNPSQENSQRMKAHSSSRIQHVGFLDPLDLSGTVKVTPTVPVVTRSDLADPLTTDSRPGTGGKSTATSGRHNGAETQLKGRMGHWIIFLIGLFLIMEV